MVYIKVNRAGQHDGDEQHATLQDIHKKKKRKGSAGNNEKSIKRKMKVTDKTVEKQHI
jgi:hypothetical protein